jgi:hypothetical protein
MSALEQLAERTRSGFPNLFAARARTERELRDKRESVREVGVDDDAAVVLFGSWGRHELTPHSDDDWVILVNGGERDGVRPSTDEMERRIGVAERKPGAQGVFGDIVFCDHLVGRIGLDTDDNRNLTRRVLLLLESQPVANDRVHRDCWERVLEGYLDDSVKDFRPPRFLLNDVIRYWRTICVDFVGKERQGTGEKWALRNLKLRTSRRVLFAGGLLPILLCHRHSAKEMRPFLVSRLALPPTDRLAAAFLDCDVPDAGVRALGAYDRWIEMLCDEAVRAELNAIPRSDVDTSLAYQEGRRLAEELEQGLLALLFETPLASLVREYGIF